MLPLGTSISNQLLRRQDSRVVDLTTSIASQIVVRRQLVCYASGDVWWWLSACSESILEAQGVGVLALKENKF